MKEEQNKLEEEIKIQIENALLEPKVTDEATRDALIFFLTNTKNRINSVIDILAALMVRYPFFELMLRLKISRVESRIEILNLEGKKKENNKN